MRYTEHKRLCVFYLFLESVRSKQEYCRFFNTLYDNFDSPLGICMATPMVSIYFTSIVSAVYQLCIEPK